MRIERANFQDDEHVQNPAARLDADEVDQADSTSRARMASGAGDHLQPEPGAANAIATAAIAPLSITARSAHPHRNPASG